MEPRLLESSGIKHILKVNGIPSNFPYDQNKFTEKIIHFDDTPEF